MNRPSVGMTWTLEVRDRRGRLARRLTRPSRSYVRAFLDWLACNFGAVSITLVPDTGGTNRTIGNSTGMNALGPNDNSNYGPVLGTGIGAVLITDNKLGTQIVHGVVPFTLDHQATEFLNLGTVGATRRFQLRRLFVNASGASITINECGVYFLNMTFNYCGIRDLVTPGVSIPNLSTATLIYTISISV